MRRTKKYAIVDNKLSTIRLADSWSHHPMYDYVFEKYNLSDDKVTLEGEVLDYAFEMSGASRSTPLDEIDDSQIKNKKFLWWTWKSVKSGWILLKKRKHMKITNPKGFIVIEGDVE